VLIKIFKEQVFYQFMNSPGSTSLCESVRSNWPEFADLPRFGQGGGDVIGVQKSMLGTDNIQVIRLGCRSIRAADWG